MLSGHRLRHMSSCRQAPALFQGIVTGCGEGILAWLVFVNVNAKAWLTSVKMYYEAAYTDTVLNM